MTFHIQGAAPTAVILDETHRWQITTEPIRVEAPPPCACGNRRDIHWQHDPEGCTWREPAR